MILGVDVSKYQPVNLPWREWAGRVSVVSIQITHGHEAEPKAVEHHNNAMATGYSCVGAYHYLLPGDGAGQAAFFLKSLLPGYSWLMLDIEDPGVTAADVEAFCTFIDAHSNLPLVLYGNHSLEALLGANNPRYSKYGLVVADYGDGFITSIPPEMTPHVPHVGHRIGWQFTGRGRQAPYLENIDLTTWDKLPNGAAFSDVRSQPNGALYGAHGESGNQIIPIQKKLRSHGVSLAVVLSEENPGLSADAKANGVPLTISRFSNKISEYEGGGSGRLSWPMDKRRNFVETAIQIAFKLNNTEYEGSDYLQPGYNEWDSQTVEEWQATGEVFCMLCDEAARRSPEMVARGLHPIRLALPVFNAGTPKTYPMYEALFGASLGEGQPTLARKMKDGGHLLLVHEGVFWDQPIDYLFGNVVPEGYVVENSGDLCLRVNVAEYVFEKLIGEGIDWVAGEWYDGNNKQTDPAIRLAAMRWYDQHARSGRYGKYYHGFCAFELTDNPNSDWAVVDFTNTFNSSELLADMVAQKDDPNPTKDKTVMPILKVEKQAMHDAATVLLAKIDAIVTDDVPQPLYKATVLYDCLLRDKNANLITHPTLAPKGVVVTGTQVEVWAELDLVNGYVNRAVLTLDASEPNICFTTQAKGPSLKKL